MTATYRNHRCAVCRVVIQKHLRLCNECEASVMEPFQIQAITPVAEAAPAVEPERDFTFTEIVGDPIVETPEPVATELTAEPAVAETPEQPVPEPQPEQQ